MLDYRKILKLSFQIITGIVLLAVISVPAYYFWAASRLPHIGVCRTLGSSTPWSDTHCRDAEGLYRIIQERFPIEATTRDEVKNVLGEYLVVSSIDSETGKSRDSYGITPLMFSNAIVSFYFDENDSLIEIHFYD